MSGIVGLWYLDGRPIDRIHLTHMADRLAHRGPHGRGVWSLDGVGLGHRLMHTTSESLHEAQPHVHAATGHVIVADARLDNREELIRALRPTRYGPGPVTDAALILTAYERWGTECATQLIGDFAFAIWDARGRRLYCARDPMGVRALYYHSSRRLFAFASEIKALLCVREVPREIGERQVGNFLESFAEDARDTLYQGIERLPAGHSLTITGRGADVLSAYHRPRFTAAAECRSDDEYAEAFRSIFLESVRCRTRSTLPVATTLSGGLDSSSIACAARELFTQHHRGRVHAVSAVFPGLPPEERRVSDESDFIDSVLASGGFAAQRVSADELSPLGNLEMHLARLDVAPLAYNLYMHWALYGMAAQAGCRVFLDGIDGDACVGHGQERLSELADAGDWTILMSEISALCCTLKGPDGPSPMQLTHLYAGPVLERLARSGRWASLIRSSSELASGPGISRGALLLHHGAMPLARALLQRTWRRTRARPRPSPLHKAFVTRVGLREHQAESRAARRPAGGDLPELLGSPAYQYVLELCDASAAAFGLESRFPFFDERLIAFCAALPAAQKLSGGWTRSIQRRAMEGTLPPAIQWRATKQDLSPNFRRGLRGVDRHLVEGAALRRDHPLNDILDMPMLRHRLRRFMADEALPHDQDDAQLLYRATVLTRWLDART